MIYISIQNKSFSNQIKYVFDNIFFLLGVEHEYIEDNLNKFTIYNRDILIEYNMDDSISELKEVFSNHIVIKGSKKLFGKNYLSQSSLSESVRYYFLKEQVNGISDIVSIYSDDEELYIKNESKLKNTVGTNIDIISDSFFMLTRYEEVVNDSVTEKEKFKRFSSKESLAYKNNFLTRPIVNEYVDILWSWIDGFNLGYQRRCWWKDKDFAACISHDIDVVQKFRTLMNGVKTTGNLLLRYKTPTGAIKNFLNYIESQLDYKKDPYWTFEYLTNLEKKHNFRTSYYFMSGGTSEVDNFYRIDDEKVSRLIDELESNGFEVGYHGSFNSFNDIEQMRKEKEELDKQVKYKPYGIRQHYLRFKVPYTWRQQEKLGFLYDTTLTYADYEGFRCGYCFPFKPYDLLENRIIDIWEIPLIVMEGTLKDIAYRGYDPEIGLKKIIEYIDIVRRHHGVFTLLWHNSSFDYNWNGWKEVLEKSMDYMVKSNCLGTDGRSLVNQLKLLK